MLCTLIDVIILSINIQVGLNMHLCYRLPLDQYFPIIRSEVGRSSFAIRLGYRGRCGNRINKNIYILVIMLKTRQKLKDGQAICCTSFLSYGRSTLILL